MIENDLGIRLTTKTESRDSFTSKVIKELNTQIPSEAITEPDVRIRLITVYKIKKEKKKNLAFIIFQSC